MLKKIYLFIFLFSFSIEAKIQEDYKSGHVIVVHYDQATYEHYIIFGLSKKGKLSTFGGLRDPSETHPKNTAAREAEEEALGVLGSKSMVREMLKGLKEITKNDGHYCYILPCKDYGNALSERFTALRFNPELKLPFCKKEMVDLVTVRVETIRDKVWLNEKLEFEDNHGKLRPLRSKHIIQNAVRNGCLDRL